MKNAIETERLFRRFGRTEAVRDLSLEVPEGSIYAFLGPNGAGKTTTIKVLRTSCGLPRAGQPHWGPIRGGCGRRILRA